MEKTGFRYERKENPHPVPLQRRGECRDEKLKETSPFSHTPLSRGTYPAIAGYLNEGECGESFIG